MICLMHNGGSVNMMTIMETSLLLNARGIGKFLEAWRTCWDRAYVFEVDSGTWKQLCCL